MKKCLYNWRTASRTFVSFYLAEKGYKPTVFEKNEKAGGMLVYGIPSFKLEKDIVEAEIDVIQKMGVDIKTGVEVGKDITIVEDPFCTYVFQNSGLNDGN